MNILVSGASGFIGSHLVPVLLSRGHYVVCMTRNPAKVTREFLRTVNVVQADALRPETMERVFVGIDVAYYLIHSLGAGETAFREADRLAARNFARAAKNAGVQRVIYLGGLGDADNTNLSVHLTSRQESGEELRAWGPPVTEFRSAVVIGAGSLSFEMIRYLTERLPIMICPRWVTTRIQPIAVEDVVGYLAQAIEVPASAGKTIDIGSPSIETYRSMMLKYAALRGLRRFLLQVPVLTPRLSSYWVDLVTPIDSAISRPLIEGLRNEVTCRNDLAQRLFPGIHPMSFEQALQRALAVPNLAEVANRRAEKQFASRNPGSVRHRVKEEEGWVVDIREGFCEARPSELFSTVEGIGGQRGWFYGDWLWSLRGWLDRLLGGRGTDRGRRDPDLLRVGDKVDFWAVVEIEVGRRLVLKANMKLPGEAYLMFETFPDCMSGSRLRSTALYRPRGLFGRLYWWVLLPLHRYIFSGMNGAICRRAKQGSVIRGGWTPATRGFPAK